MVNSMQANEAPQERMSAAWRLHKRGYEPRRGSVMVKTIDATTTDRLRRSPLYLGLSPSCARKRACMELTTICRFQRLLNPSFRLFQCFQSGAPLRGCGSVGWEFDFMLKACPYPGCRFSLLRDILGSCFLVDVAEVYHSDEDRYEDGDHCPGCDFEAQAHFFHWFGGVEWDVHEG